MRFEAAEEVNGDLAAEMANAMENLLCAIAEHDPAVGIHYLREPLTRAQVRAFLDGPTKCIEGVVRVTLSELQGDFETFLDLLDERLIGGHGLGNITHKLVGVIDGDALLRVTGTEVDNDWLNEDDEDASA